MDKASDKMFDVMDLMTEKRQEAIKKANAAKELGQTELAKNWVETALSLKAACDVMRNAEVWQRWADRQK